ncbi:MAG: ArgE/DapE family deacylase [Caldiserica bacterium]|nr:ArgE/DapE family deacylase [Caldisericota bacterium]
MSEHSARRERAYLISKKQELINFLKELISLSSVTGGGEKQIQEHLKEVFSSLALKTELVPFPPELQKHQEYISLPQEYPLSERKNLLAFWEGEGERSIIINTHSDVVGPADWEDAFSPRVEGDWVIGRGAVDCKGQIAALYLAFLAIKDLGLKIRKRGHIQIVIEEEVGGNGSLAAILSGYRGDGVIVMEASRLNIHPANRGAIWFRITIKGKPVHMGRKYEGVNAIEKMMQVIESLQEYERKLLKESQNVPLFQEYSYPVQVNVGTIKGGEWPSMVADEAVIEGGVGFLPNKSISQVKEELAEILSSHPDAWIRKNYTLEFPKLRNEAYAISPEHWLVKELQCAAEKAEVPSRVTGFIVSCDARLFYHVGKMPVVVFGPGDICEAHSREEKISIDEIIKASEILIHFLTREEEND